jgi:hypothetical protein
MNLCTACGLDFGSVGAFSAHRVGKHEYDWSPEREDGRRCLDTDELRERGWKQDTRGRWRQPADPDALLRIRESRGAAVSTSEEVGEG